MPMTTDIYIYHAVNESLDDAALACGCSPGPMGVAHALVDGGYSERWSGDNYSEMQCPGQHGRSAIQQYE